MSQDLKDLITTSCDLLALGEPTHLEPAFAQVRNELFRQLADLGFRSIALETDRVAALMVNDFVQNGEGTLDAAMSEGFSHDFGDLVGNRQLIAWMREYNKSRPAAEQLTFHGFDIPTEMFSAPSPRRYLEYGRDYLIRDLAGHGLAFLDIVSLAGDDERWSRTEAVMNPAESIGATAEADRLRAIADDLLTMLYTRAPELIASTSRADWLRAKTHLTAGLDLLRYHKQCAQHLEQNARISVLSSTRDALMAQNLLEIRDIETNRGSTLVFSQNLHLQRNPGRWRLADMDINWYPAGAIFDSLTNEQYVFIAGSLGRSEAIGLQDAPPDTYEADLQTRVTTWDLIPADTVKPAQTRTDTKPEQGYFPLDQATVNAADLILHIPTGTPSST